MSFERNDGETHRAYFLRAREQARGLPAKLKDAVKESRVFDEYRLGRVSVEALEEFLVELERKAAHAASQAKSKAKASSRKAA